LIFIIIKINIREMLDLRPYGMGWSIDNKADNVIVPSDFLNSVSKITFDGTTNSFSVSRFDGTVVEYVKGARLGAGSYGEVFACSRAGDPKEYIVKYIAGSAMRDVIKEALVQVIIVEQTQTTVKLGGALTGPFAPRVYDIGYNAPFKVCYIFSERLPQTLQHFWINSLAGKSVDAASHIVAQMVMKISIMLNELYNSLELNHRDLKSDNCMVRMVGGQPQPCLIDFGFSCIKYGERRIDCNMTRFQYCALRRRDMSQLLYEMNRYYPSMPDPVKDIIKDILTFPRNGRVCKMTQKTCIQGWANTYDFMNHKEQNPNGHPVVVYNIFNAFNAGLPWKDKLAWAVPVKPAAVKPASVAIIRACPAGKELNPKTKRCVKACGPGKKRNASFKCVADKTVAAALAAALVGPVAAAAAPAAAAPAAVAGPCPADKEYNPTTKRCVKACGPGKKRNAAFKCVADKTAAVPAVLGPCSAGKERNPKTKRCVKVCPRGKKRNATFKCVAATPVAGLVVPVADKPCAAGKERNPKTKRCVKECPPNKKRNPATFKCVNK
jgi:hypothetical protein